MCEIAKEFFEHDGKSKYPSELIDVGMGISKNYEKLDREEDAAEAMGIAIEAARMLDHEELDDLLRDQGRYWYRAGQYESSIACHLEAMSISQMHLRNESPEIDNFNVGMGLYELKRYEEAEDAFFKSMAAYKELGDVPQVVDCHFRLTEIYMALENAVEIEHHGQKALDFYTVIGNDRRVWTLKYFLGVANRILGESETASRLFDEARNLAIAMGWQEWEFLIKVDKEIAGLFRANGLDDSADEILRRIKSIEELVAKEGNQEAI
jgi:tetratricopeptide (TPR) repeat protein